MKKFKKVINEKIKKVIFAGAVQEAYITANPSQKKRII